MDKTSVTHPVDTGWAWVVLCSSFYVSFIAEGFLFAIPVYFVEFLEVFHENASTTAWIASLNGGIFCAVGPLASSMIHKWGHRATIIAGAIFSAGGLVICSEADSIITVFLAFGALSGFGCGIAFTGGVVVIEEYFQKWRPLALGIAACGGSFGNMAFPWITKALLEIYGWRGSLLMTAAIHLQMCVFAMLILPPVKTDNKQQTNTAKHIDREYQVSSMTELTRKLFDNRSYILLLWSSMIYASGLSILYTFIVALFESEGLSLNMCNVVLSAMGLATLVGNLGLSGLSQLPGLNSVLLHSLSAVICGIAMILMGIWKTVEGFFITSLMFATFSASLGPILTECAYIICGSDLFAFAYGYIMVANGLGCVIGPPISGYMYDATQSYPNAFYLGGAITIVGGLFYLPILLDRDLFKPENKEDSKCPKPIGKQRPLSFHLIGELETVM